MVDAQNLLVEYVQTGSDAAFRELVTRYIDLVYSTALRLVSGDTHQAEDVTQTVFVDLARKARTLSPEVMLGGWLHRHTCFVAAKIIRGERRRQIREREAAEMNALSDDSGAVFRAIAPILDDAINQLGEEDRAAILLRFFEQRDFRSMGEALGASEDAARMRVTRALEKLRQQFKRQGVTAGAAALGLTLSAGAVLAAPAGLAAVVSTAAVLSGSALSTSTAATATKAIAMTALQKTLVTATVAVLAGAGIYEARQAAGVRAEMKTFQERQAVLAGQVQQLQRERRDLTNRVASVTEELEKAKSDKLELLKLRAEKTQFHNEAEIENDPAFQKARLWIAKENRLRELFNQRPDQSIPEMKFLSDEEWLDQARGADLGTANGMRCALSNVRAAATFDFGSKILQALQAYLSTHHQQPPDSIDQLNRYFQPPVENADALLARYEMLSAEKQADPAYQGALIIQKTLVDPIDTPILVGLHTVSLEQGHPGPAAILGELEPIIKSYNDANPNQSFMSFSDLQPYATTAAEKEVLAKVIKATTPPR